MRWPWMKADEEVQFSDAQYKRRLSAIQLAEKRLNKIKAETDKAIAQAQKSIEDAVDAVQIEIEQAQATVRQYKKEVERLQDENDVQGSTIEAMTASHQTTMERWREEASIHAIRARITHPPGEE